MTEIYSFIPIKWYVKAIKKYVILGINYPMPFKLYSLILILSIFTSCFSSKIKVLDLSARKIITGQKISQPYHTIELKLLVKKGFKSMDSAKIIYDSDTLDTQLSILSANTSAYDTIVLKSRTVRFDKDSRALMLMYFQDNKAYLKKLPQARWIENKQIPI